jgi:hypothetical protein
MNPDDFIKAVATMRNLQRSYFETRKTDNHAASQILSRCKTAERQVDQMLKELTNNQINLF